MTEAILLSPDVEGLPTGTSQKLPLSMAGIIGSASQLVELFRVVDHVAPAECPVLVTGERGTGTELVARAVHNHSARAEGPLVVVNCANFRQESLELELFGHAHGQGKNTGPKAPRVGRIQAAQGGTLFLDEVSEMSAGLQVKLLRVLQYKEFSPIGDAQVWGADVRLVTASQQDLRVAVRAGKFREDLYDHLSAVRLTMPPLRERFSDFDLLVNHFFQAACERLGRADLIGISDTAMDLLDAHRWPGNVRELESTLERAALLALGPEIEASDVAACLGSTQTAPRSSYRDPFEPEIASHNIDLHNAVELYESKLIQDALERTGWNKKHAAQLLGINRSTLVEMLRRKRIVRAA
jgi:DNA-binding NtrC family response regulator